MNLRQRFMAFPPGLKILTVLVAIIVGVNVVGAVGQLIVGEDPSGPPSSTFGTTPEGLAALAELLERVEVEVDRSILPINEMDLDGSETIVIAEPQLVLPSEGLAIEQFLADGGRLVFSGDPLRVDPSAAANTGADRPPVWDPEGVGGQAQPARGSEQAPEVAGVGEVATTGNGIWIDVANFTPLLVVNPDGDTPDDSSSDTSSDNGSGGVVAAAADVGAGRVVAIADVGIWQNQLLGSADNAAFAYAAVGSGGRPVIFAEAAHGVGRQQGLGVFPRSWRWVAAGLALSALLLIWSAGHRLGPPELADRELGPSRGRYAEAVALNVSKVDKDRTVLTQLEAEETEHSK